MSDFTEDQQSVAANYVVRIQAEHDAARAAAPNYAEIVAARKAVMMASATESVSDLLAAAAKYPWITAPAPRAPVRTAPVAHADQGPAIPDFAAPARTVTTSNLPVEARVIDSGRMAFNSETGKLEPLRTVINPTADAEARRLSKETGMRHIVNKNGEVESTQIPMPTPLPDGGTIVMDPLAIIEDIRPEVSGQGKGFSTVLPG